MPTKTRATVTPKTEAAAVTAIAAELETRALVQFKDLDSWSGNPRRVFDQGAIDDLQKLIEQQGILQNLVVRRRKGKRLTGTPSYEIIAGERRWHAFGNLIEEGKRSREDLVPVIVRDLDDTQALAIALAENVGRQNLSPLEEAEGFQKLAKAGKRTSEIAADLPYSQRFVQLRIAMAENLCKEAKDALEKDELPVKKALLMARYVAKTDQPDAVLELKGNWFPWNQSTTKLEEFLKGQLIDLEVAEFDIAKYKGYRVTIGGKTYAQDRAAFAVLQNEAVSVIAEKHRKTYKWVEIRSLEDYTQRRLDDYPKCRPSDDGCGCIIGLNKDLSVEIITDRLRPPPRATGRAAPRDETGALKPEGWLPTKAAIRDAKIDKATALQNAMMENCGDQVAKCMVIVGLLRSRGRSESDMMVDGPARYETAGQGVKASKLQPAFEKLSAYLGKLVQVDTGHPRKSLRPWSKDTGYNDDFDVGILQALLKAPEALIDAAFRALLFSTVGPRHSNGEVIGDSHLIRFLAATAKANVGTDPDYQLTAEKLERFSKPSLVALASQLGVKDHDGLAMTAERMTDKLTAKVLREKIQELLAGGGSSAAKNILIPGPWTYGTEAEITKRSQPTKVKEPTATERRVAHAKAGAEALELHSQISESMAGKGRKRPANKATGSAVTGTQKRGAKKAPAKKGATTTRRKPAGETATKPPARKAVKRPARKAVRPAAAKRGRKDG